MLKPPVTEKKMQEKSQPPSGGCVLKPDGAMEFEIKGVPAAFRRLCVETKYFVSYDGNKIPAAFRRLCVETTSLAVVYRSLRNQPPSGGCVLKLSVKMVISMPLKPAAFRRLCVETGNYEGALQTGFNQPPSGGCVLKHTRSGDKRRDDPQPPSGGCVLKLRCARLPLCCICQPPSGGCVLKPAKCIVKHPNSVPSRLQAAVC